MNEHLLRFPYPRSPMGSWPERALCREMVQRGEAKPEWWFPERAQSARPAKTICAACVVRARCLAWALENGEEGVWGGTSRRERRGMDRPLTCGECKGAFRFSGNPGNVSYCSTECAKAARVRRRKSA